LGRDIHVMVEVGSLGDFSAFGDGPFHISRDYQLFQCLAGCGGSWFLQSVSGLEEDKFGTVKQARGALKELGAKEPLIRPRGLPPRYSEEVAEAVFFGVRDDDDNEPWMYDWVTRAQADKWVASGQSFYCDSGAKTRTVVSNPDLHTISYLSLQEIGEALRHHGLELAGTPIEFQAIVAAMKVLEGGLGKGRTRIVFWFDN